MCIHLFIMALLFIKAQLNTKINTEPKLEHGIGYVYAVVDYICTGFVDLRGKLSKREFQNEKFLYTLGSGPSIIRYEVQCVTYCATKELLNTVLK